MRRTIRALLLSLLGLIVLAFAYIFFWPVDIDPVAWTPPPAPALAPTGKLSGAERVLAGRVAGPEALVFDEAGNLYTGLADGRVIRMRPDRSVETLANTGGRPLGLAIDRDGRVIVADARAGLLSISIADGGKVTVLAANVTFADDVVIAPDGIIYFTDASSRHGFGHDREDIMEHRATGRVLAYDPAAAGGKLTVVTEGLAFANGITIAPDGSYLLVNESAAYRVSRIWLSGPQKGTVQPFAENLPGFPDNITLSPRGGAWVALYAPRVAALDWLLPRPWARKVIRRLPSLVQPKPVHHGICVHLDDAGRVTAILDDDGPDAYAPITTCREREGKLWLGSVERDAIGVLTIP